MPEKKTPAGIFPENKVSAEKVSAEKMPEKKISAEKVSAEKISDAKMSAVKLPELLSPAGSPEAARAAVAAGADAVYIGGRMLNARMNAKNFTDGELKSTVSYCHGHGVKVYVTVNTAVYDKELKSAATYVDFLYSAGVDALILSDIGLASLIKDRYPGMELHASTQASGHNADCARAFEKLGFSRMVCARELTMEDIFSLCRESPIEIEQFVHGAICVSQSGQCLASAIMGGRSGNRGVCAQPCRMKYNGSYPLSIKDMCLASHITDLIASGVASLKLEGRMKSPAYVYEVTRVYRKLLDERRNATDEEVEHLKKVFSRGGFTAGYYEDKRDSDMNGVRSADDIVTTRTLKTEFVPVRRSLPVITVIDRTPNGDIPFPKPAKGEKKSGRPILTARFYRPENVTGRDFFKHIYLPLDKYESGLGADGVLLPPSVFPTDEKRFRDCLEKAVSRGAKEALVCHIGQIPVCLEYGLTPHGDYRLNVFGTASASAVTALGVRDVILSPELTLPQMRDVSAPKAAIVYGKLPIMLLTKDPGCLSLRDTTGATFGTLPEWRYTLLLNSVPFYMGDLGDRLDAAGIKGRHFIFTDESEKECAAVIKMFSAGAEYPGKIRRIAK